MPPGPQVYWTSQIIQSFSFTETVTNLVTINQLSVLYKVLITRQPLKDHHVDHFWSEHTLQIYSPGSGNNRVHPSILSPLIQDQIAEAAVSARGPRLPFPATSTSSDRSWGILRPVQRYNLSTWPAPGSLPSWTCLKHLPRKATRRHLTPSMTPFDAKEQQLYSKSSSDHLTSHFILKGEASHPPEDTHFSRL